MKDTARILKLEGKELRTPGDVTVVLETLMLDLANGDITPAESKKIMREVTAKMKTFGSMLKTVQGMQHLDKLILDGRQTLRQHLSKLTRGE